MTTVFATTTAVTASSTEITVVAGVVIAPIMGVVIVTGFAAVDADYIAIALDVIVSASVDTIAAGAVLLHYCCYHC